MNNELWPAVAPVISSTIHGMKFDSAKPEYSLIPPYALDDVVKVLSYGCKKYAKENWRYVENANDRYYSAAQRHLWAISRGEINDPDSGLHHVSHAITSLMFLHEHMNNTHTILNPLHTKSK